MVHHNQAEMTSGELILTLSPYMTLFQCMMQPSVFHDMATLCICHAYNVGLKPLHCNMTLTFDQLKYHTAGPDPIINQPTKCNPN